MISMQISQMETEHEPKAARYCNAAEREVSECETIKLASDSTGQSDNKTARRHLGTTAESCSVGCQELWMEQSQGGRC